MTLCGINEKGNAGAILSDDTKYRYNLWRCWDECKDFLVWIMLNPSTADGTADDATIRRCVGYAKAWGYGGISVYNLFAYRATDPKRLRKAWDPVGPENDRYLSQIPEAAMVMCAWGVNGNYWVGRVGAVLRLMAKHKLYHLGIASKQPKHPLRLAKTLQPIPLETATGLIG